MKWKLKLKGEKLPSGPIQVHIQAPGEKKAPPDYPSTATQSPMKKTGKTHLFGARRSKI